jgi:hypothetical protein
MKVFFLESLFIFETFKHVLFKCGDLSKLFLLKINLFFSLPNISVICINGPWHGVD